jgi:CDP-4-dehydro-6-deoxyglucose reductase
MFAVAEGASVLTAAYEAGIKLPNGCRMGTCRTCRGHILEGAVDHGHSHTTYLSYSERDEGYALLCQARPCSDLVIEAEELPLLADPLVLPAYIKSINRVRADVAIVRLRLPLHSYTQFAAGQYIDLILPDGKRRAYSIANPPEPQGVIDLDLHIRHLAGGLFTDQLFATAKERDRVEIEVPLGTFFLRDSDKPVIFLATGTGYAPIRSIILDALAWGRGRPMTLYWGARCKADLYLLEEAEKMAEQHDLLTFVPVLSRPTPVDEWTGRVGHVQDAALADIADPWQYQVYACGSPAMTRSAKQHFCERGLSENDFFADAFVTEADVLPDE